MTWAATHFSEKFSFSKGVRLSTSATVHPRGSQSISTSTTSGPLSAQTYWSCTPRVERAVIELARRPGNRVQQSTDVLAGRKFYLDYHSVSGPQYRIEVDLNFLFRTPFVPPVRRELWQPGELDRPMVPCVGDDELLTGKLLVLVERCAARDAWDVANLAPDLVACLGKSTFRARFVAIAGMLDHPLGTYGRELLEAQLTTAEVREPLLPMLAPRTAM